MFRFKPFKTNLVNGNKQWKSKRISNNLNTFRFLIFFTSIEDGERRDN